jgi:choline dehydrogenase-like flavoprotein
MTDGATSVVQLERGGRSKPPTEDVHFPSRERSTVRPKGPWNAYYDAEREEDARDEHASLTGAIVLRLSNAALSYMENREGDHHGGDVLDEEEAQNRALHRGSWFRE